MKLLKLIILAIFLLAVPEVNAQTRFYSSSGRYVGRAYFCGPTTRFYSSTGKYSGSAYSRGYITRFYGSTGKYVGATKKGTKK